MDTDTSLICRSLLAGDRMCDPLSGVPGRLPHGGLWAPSVSNGQAGAYTRPLALEACPLLLARHRRAFSLIEVIIAVGVFAVAVVVILALLPPLSREATDSADALVAQSLPDSVRVELSRLAASGGR